MCGLCLSLPWSFTLATPARALDDDVAFFEKKIRPVLVAHCYPCHSAEAEKLKGGLRLDTREGLLKGGENGPVIVPGQPEQSRLIAAIRHTNPDLQMPPAKDGAGKLPEAVIADFVAWVRRGTPDPRTGRLETQKSTLDTAKAWAFRKPVPPSVPRVKNKRWPASPLDHFILAKLEAKKLAPAPPADKRTLIRRATFDLLGLPPTPQEVDDFLADSSRDAFAKVVERLLASPHYGERWARHWLDVVRYTDSFDARGLGGEADVPEAWRYRDWVVRAFNDDLPYDQFILQQFAGDILATNQPGRFDTNALLATGVFVLGEWGTGDADKEKMLTDIVDDQVDVTGRAFLGLTLACARCHDHKFDPITTRDYYALAGIFFSSHILPSPGVKTAGSPVLRLPLVPAEELAWRREKEARLAALEKELATNAAAALLDRPLRGEFNQPALALLHGEAGDLPNASANASDAAIRFLTITLPPRSVAVHPSPERAAAAVWVSPFDGAAAVRGRVADADDKCGNGAEWKLFHGQRELATGKFDNGKDSALAATEVTVRAGDLLCLAVLARGKDHSCDTTVIEFEVREQGGAGRVWRLPDDVVADLPARANTGAWHFVSFAGTPPATLAPPELSADEQAARERKKRELAGLREVLSRPLPVAHALQEGGTPKSAHEGFHDVRVHLRGRYDRLGDVVPRGFPKVLAGDAAPPFTTNASGRLELARWIASPDHPLTARVMVNRIWQHHFGEGLVRTPNNYGKLGEPPTHPELLDWLAGEFVQAGWSVKAMHRAIMLSAAYRQSSVPQPETLKADPDNRLFGRMNRRRLEAEAIRDSLLVAAGNLDRATGGPAVRDLNTKRRTLYVMTIRSDRATYQSLFDAADPAAIVEKRLDSTVAPQALFLLNHPFALAQTKALAQRVAREAPADDRGKIQWLYRQLYGRPPTGREVTLGVTALDRARRAEAGSGGAHADDPAWEQLCQVLLCANEFVYVD
jgi:hypothetical protein